MKQNKPQSGFTLIEIVVVMAIIGLVLTIPGKQGKLLNLRDIEQGLEQINRLQSVQATTDLLPGEEIGASVIQLKSTRSQPWQLSLTRNNNGQDATGESLNGAFLGWDNLLGLNDYTYINYQQDNTSSGARANNSTSFHWDVPLGYWSAEVDISYFEYGSTVNSIATTFKTSGENFSQRASLSRVLLRDQTSKLTARAQLERKDTENFIEDTLIENSSRVLSVGTFGLDYEKFFPGQLHWQMGVNYHRGLNIFDSLSDKDRLAGTPRAQFEKYTARMDIQKQFDLRIGETNLPLTAQSSLNLQQSNDRLFGSEQISVGSLFTVRGYKGTSLSAASGGYWRNSLSSHWQPSRGGVGCKRFNR